VWSKGEGQSHELEHQGNEKKSLKATTNDPTVKKECSQESRRVKRASSRRGGAGRRTSKTEGLARGKEGLPPSEEGGERNGKGASRSSK